MLAWLRDNWGWLMAATACAAYFGFYVLAARERRSAPNRGRTKPEKDC